MAVASLSINEFFGIQQHKDGALLPVGSARDCRNVTTVDGNLSVAKGYAKYIEDIVPGSDRILKLIKMRGDTPKDYVVTANKIYSHDGDKWNTLYTFSTALTTKQIDYVQTLVGPDDCLIIATGQTQMLKVKLSDDTVVLFGTGEYSFQGTVLSYNAGTKVVTLSASLSAEALRHAPLDGITIDGTWLAVTTATGATVTLTEAPAVAPVSPNAATIRGGGSTAQCNFVETYFGRLLACGDPSNPSRLYWSAVSGDGRTIEDWLSVEGSADASGGYAEVGESSGDGLRGFKTLATEMFLLKRHTVFRLFGDTPSTFNFQQVETFSELSSNASIVVKYNAPYFLTGTGIKYYDGTGVLPLNGGIRFINTFIQTISSVEESKGVHADNMLYFSCKVDPDSVYDDTLIVYDISRTFSESSYGSYTIRDGFQIADMVSYDGSIYLINDKRYVYLFNDGESYDGAVIDAYWSTQFTDMGNKLKQYQVTHVVFRGGEGKMSITIDYDQAHKSKSVEVFDEKAPAKSVRIDTDNASAFGLTVRNQYGSAFSINGGIQIVFRDELVNVI